MKRIVCFGAFHTAGLIDPSPQRLRGQPVASGHGVGVDVQRGGGPGVAQAGRHDRNGDAGIEHLGRHEVAEVVEWKWQVMDSAFANAGIRRNSGFEVGQIAEMVLYVANGLGTAIVPRAFVSGTPTGSSPAREIGPLRPVEPNLHLEIGVFARKDRLSTPSRRFLELVSQDSSAVATFLESATKDRSSGTVW
jgi:DNA-binding transcriptional LysR family regulator